MFSNGNLLIFPRQSCRAYSSYKISPSLPISFCQLQSYRVLFFQLRNCKEAFSQHRNCMVLFYPYQTYKGRGKICFNQIIVVKPLMGFVTSCQLQSCREVSFPCRVLLQDQNISTCHHRLRSSNFKKNIRDVCGGF